MKFDAVILAGGQSRRMGRDKGLMEYDAPPQQRTINNSNIHGSHVNHPKLNRQAMVSWVAGSLKGAETLWVNTNDHIASYEELGFTVIGDVLHPDIGPLAGPLLGILTGLQATKSEWVLFSPCDTPTIPRDYPEVMTKFARDNLSYANVVFDGERRQNLHLLLHRSLMENLQMYLLAGGRKTHQWLDRVDAKEVDFSSQKTAFKNINSPSDL